jgi:hypothetical protein
MDVMGGFLLRREKNFDFGSRKRLRNVVDKGVPVASSYVASKGFDYVIGHSVGWSCRSGRKVAFFIDLADETPGQSVRVEGVVEEDVQVPQ